MTVDLDPDSGGVAFVGDGKGTEAPGPFGKRRRPGGAVAMGRSGAYRSAIRAHLPEAAIVFGHSRVIKLFNDELSELRRAPYRKATDVQHEEALNATRWLLRENPEDLDPEEDKGRRLREALKPNEALAPAYDLKDDLGGPGSGRGSGSPRRSSPVGSAGRGRRGSRSCSG